MKCIKSFIKLTISACLLWACGSTGKTEEKISEEQTPSYQCYGSYTDTDSVFLKLTFTGDDVTGDLTYKLYEKDKNQGTLTGVMHGDTLLAIYRFTSEGKTSIRDVAFIKQGNNLVEGFAPLDEEGVHFKSKNDIDFAGIVLQPGECHD
ncbi:MAG: hypothetical protein C0490_20085 [Marivirga sp.]|nr:hypothetical protein [Marivirga sp.]